MKIRTCMSSVLIAWTAVTWSNETQTWSEAPDNGVWSTTEANWEGGRVWTQGNRARFGMSTVTDLSVDSQVIVSNIVFAAGNYVLSGGGSIVTP